MWFKHWLRLPSESSKEGYKKVNKDICENTILKVKWGKLKVNAMN